MRVKGGHKVREMGERAEERGEEEEGTGREKGEKVSR